MIRRVLLLLAFLAITAGVAPATSSQERYVASIVVINGNTTTGISDVYRVRYGTATAQAIVTGTGAVTATVKIQVSDYNTGPWLDLATITLSGTSSASDGTSWVVPWAFARANVTALTGTNAAVSVSFGESS